jgi:hypothetical protein
MIGVSDPERIRLGTDHSSSVSLRFQLARELLC